MELDNFKDVKLVIDKANDVFIQKQFVSNGDIDGRTLTVQLTNDGEIGASKNTQVNLRWNNLANGITDLSAFELIDASKSIYRIEYPTNMLTPGDVKANIQIIQNGKVTHLKTFSITVQRLAGNDKGFIENSQYSALVKTLTDASKFRADIDTLADSKADWKDLNQTDANLDALNQKKADKTSLSATNAEISNLKSSKVDKNGAGQVGWGMLAQDAREQITGDKVAVVGVDSVSTENVVDGSISREKLKGSFNTAPTKLTAEDDLNSVIFEGNYISEKSNNSPEPVLGILHVRAAGGPPDDLNRWIVQTWYKWMDQNFFYKRIFDYKTGSFGAWKKYSSDGNVLSSILFENIPDAPMSNTNFLDDSVDLNNVKKEGNYVVTTALNKPKEVSSDMFLHVQVYGGKNERNRWVIQTGYEWAQPKNQWVRYLDTKSAYYTPWNRIVSEPIGVQKIGQVVCLGDSITQNNRYQSTLQTLLACDPILITGFGGTTVCRNENEYDAFGISALADEIVKDDSDTTKWRYQDDNVDKINGFATPLANIKSIDFSKVEYLTIFSGTNDYGLGYTLENYSNEYESLLTKIINKYPEIKIVILTPMWRARGSLGDGKDADFNSNGNGDYLRDFVAKTIEIAENFKLPYRDMYHSTGVNRLNHTTMMSDGLHPSAAGGKRLGSVIAATIKASY